MGSRSSDAPPPDPRLVEAQIRSMGVQDDAIRDILAVTQEMAPLQREAMQFGLDTSRTAYDQSQEDRQYALGMRDRYTAAMQPLLDEAGRFNETARRNTLYGEAVGDISQAYGSARDQMTRNLARQGVNPSDGMGQGMARRSASDEALAKVLAGRKVSEAARAEGLQLKSNAVNMLAGFPAQAAGLSGAGAGYGASGLGLANTGLAGLTSGYGAAGGMAGQWGSNATNMWNAQANYKNGQDKIAAENDPFNSILGAATGVGMRVALGGWPGAGK